MYQFVVRLRINLRVDSTLCYRRIFAHYNCESLLESLRRKGQNPISKSGFEAEFLRERLVMQIRFITRKQEGKVGWILLWLLGVPIPILLILFLVRGCT
jgi:hypothetical protein